MIGDASGKFRLTTVIAAARAARPTTTVAARRMGKDGRRMRSQGHRRGDAYQSILGYCPFPWIICVQRGSTLTTSTRMKGDAEGGGEAEKVKTALRPGGEDGRDPRPQHILRALPRILSHRWNTWQDCGAAMIGT
jgi:hypothetical protein